jgi:branched-chain amino acid transport system ATP-binding protein
MSILEVSNVSKSFGGVKANVEISMNVEKGKIVGLIGQMDLEKQLYLIQ